MEKNEVVRDEVKKDEIVLREDLNDIVKNIRFKSVKTKYGVRNSCIVTLFNDKEFEFRDSEDLTSLFQSYIDCGQKNFVKSKKLVEELKVDEEGNVIGSYICVKYELIDGSIYRLFASQFTSNKAIINYYNLYKLGKKS